MSNFKVDANLAQSTKAIGARIEEWKDNEAKNTTVVSNLLLYIVEKVAIETFYLKVCYIHCFNSDVGAKNAWTKAQNK